MGAFGRPIERPNSLDFNGFRDGESILQFDLKISYRTIHLGVAQQELNSAKVTCLLVYLGDLGPPHRVGPVRAGLKAN